MGGSGVLLIVGAVLVQVWAAPQPSDVRGAATVKMEIPPLISFKDGVIGVNFLGFKASAGLGGLLTGDDTRGGLHAEAETPFGQKAAAGLGGGTSGGRSAGGLYAGATAGGGIGASAGLGGMTSEKGATGRAFAHSSSLGGSKTVFVEPASPGATTGGTVINVQKIVIKQPDFQHDNNVDRTHVPNNPNCVDMCGRVTSFVQNTNKVTAPSSAVGVIEHEVHQPVKTVTKTKTVKTVVTDYIDEPTVVRTRTNIRRVPSWPQRRRINVNSGQVPYHGGVVAVNYRQPAATYTTTVRRQYGYNADVIRNMFNNPMATLGAVRNMFSRYSNSWYSFGRQNWKCGRK